MREADLTARNYTNPTARGEPEATSRGVLYVKPGSQRGEGARGVYILQWPELVSKLRPESQGKRENNLARVANLRSVSTSLEDRSSSDKSICQLRESIAYMDRVRF